MQTGIKIEYYTMVGESIRWHRGTLIQFDELVCRILPEGKTKAITVPTAQVQVRK